MTVGEWLDANAGDAPRHLIAEVRDALGDGVHADVSQLAVRCIDSADAVVQSLLTGGRTGRESALALLAADTLVTYAFEAAAEAPAQLPSRAAAAVRLLATLR